MKKTKDWRDGRLVLRRPEARNSAVAKSYIPLAREELEALSRCLRETVERRRAMTQGERDAELLAIAELDRRRR